MEEKKFYTKPLFIVIIVLVLVIIGISLAYAINQNIINKEKEAKIAELQKKVNNLTDYIESLQVGGNPNTNQSAAENQIPSVVGPYPEYVNDTFGFSLTIPQAWEGYLLTETANFVYFGFEDQNPVAQISIISPEQWEQVRQQENNGLVYIGETDQFVFVYSLVNQVANEDIRALLLEFPEIIETLELEEGELIVTDYVTEDEAEDEVIEEELNDNEENGEEIENEEDMNGEEIENEEVPPEEILD